MGWFDRFKNKKKPVRKDYADYEIPIIEESPVLKELPPAFENVKEKKVEEVKVAERNEATRTKSELDLWNYLKTEEKYVKNKYKSVKEINGKIDTVKVTRLNNVTNKTKIDHHNKYDVYKNILRGKIDLEDEKLTKDIVLNADKLLKHRIVGKAEFIGSDGTLIGSVTLKGFLPENKNIVDEHWTDQTIGSDNFNDVMNEFKSKKGTTIQHVTGYKNHVGKPARVETINYSFSFA